MRSRTIFLTRPLTLETPSSGGGQKRRNTPQKHRQDKTFKKGDLEAVLTKSNREGRASSSLPSIYRHIVRQHKRERSGTCASPACIQIQSFDCRRSWMPYRIDTYRYIHTYGLDDDAEDDVRRSRKDYSGPMMWRQYHPKKDANGNAIRNNNPKYIRKHAGFMYEGDSIVLDPNDNPMVNHKFIPITLSAHTM